MLILGIESTCDETAASLVEDGRKIVTNVVSSQIDLHEAFGGVVPELASRRHLEAIGPVLREAMTKTPDLIAVAQGPGLVGALLVGINAAKGLALGLKKPVMGINHVEAHLYGAVMSHPHVEFPALGVVLSGGHTALVRMEAVGRYELISTTVDDAIGEAFDKVAILLGLGYPGGPAVEALAKEGDPSKHAFSPGRVKERPLHFSFSGLKTNVRYTIDGRDLSHQDKADIAASFQESALGDVVKKTIRASEGCKTILLGGGVTNNRRLHALFEKSSLPVLWPKPELTLDNAAMIAGLAYHRFPLDGPAKDFSIPAHPRLALEGNTFSW